MSDLAVSTLARWYKDLARQFDSLGDTVSGYSGDDGDGHEIDGHEVANVCWRMAGWLKHKAENELRNQ